MYNNKQISLWYHVYVSTIIHSQAAHPPSAVQATKLYLEENVCDRWFGVDTYYGLSGCTSLSPSADPIEWLNHFSNEFPVFVKIHNKYFSSFAIIIFHSYALDAQDVTSEWWWMYSPSTTCPHVWCTTSPSVSFSQQRIRNHTRALIRGQCDHGPGRRWRLPQEAR